MPDPQWSAERLMVVLQESEKVMYYCRSGLLHSVIDAHSITFESSTRSGEVPSPVLQKDREIEAAFLSGWPTTWLASFSLLFL